MWCLWIYTVCKVGQILVQQDSPTEGWQIPLDIFLALVIGEALEVYG